MAITRAALTDGDIRTLVRGATEDERAAAARKLCRRIDVDLSPEDRAAAQEVLRLMAEDTAELVRRALAVTLESSPLLPRDVALKLAKDVESVALPILTYSPVFTDHDLAEIVRASSAAKQLAVARRPSLGAAVADALAAHGCEEAVQTACANENAAFTDTGLATAIERFAGCERIITAMAYRKVLPLSISERLAALASEAVRVHLIESRSLAAAVADTLSVAARERVTVDLVDEAGRAPDMKAFVTHLHSEERLTSSLLLRALAHGHMSFFEWGVAELSGVPHHRAWLMIHDAGALGLKAIYERAGLPARMFAAFRVGVDTYHALQQEGDLRELARFQERMLQRFLTQPQTARREDVDYLIERLDNLSRDGARRVEMAAMGAA
jgi:uncharacterized protein (DUF2336 family)